MSIAIQDTAVVLDARRNPVELTPGALDAAERGARIEVALAWGTPEQYDTFDADTLEHFVHAVAAFGDYLYDVHGEHEREGFIEALADCHGNAALVPVTVEQVERLLLPHPSIVPQDVALARTFVDALFEFSD